MSQLFALCPAVSETAEGSVNRYSFVALDRDSIQTAEITSRFAPVG